MERSRVAIHHPAPKKGNCELREIGVKYLCRPWNKTSLSAQVLVYAP